jgi:hypothetical protein
MRPTFFRPHVFGTLFFVASLANAQSGSSERPLSESLHGPAKTAYASGTLLLNNGDSVGALSKFQQAYEASNDARLLFNMAVCEKNLKAYARMQSFLARYEREAGATISAQDKATVDEALAAIKDLVGAVTVTASVAGATVTADGEAVGTTPLGLPMVLDLGKHSIVVEKPGFDRAERDIEIRGGQATALAFTLTLRTPMGHLVVSAEPGSTIVIDGKTASQDRFDGSLSAGTHEVEVTADGKAPYQADVELRDQETRTLQVSLSSTRGAPLWPWIAGGAALVAGAVVGGYFLFQTHDQVSPVPVGANNIGQVQFSAWRGL